jgi:hypothetical protein
MVAGSGEFKIRGDITNLQSHAITSLVDVECTT